MSEKVLILKTVNADMQAYDGFVWPESGIVAAPDWKATTNCGNGLHGFLWGVGNAALASDDANAKWLVFEADASTVVELSGKVKVPEANVVFCGSRDEAVGYLDAHGAADKPVMHSIRTAGDYGTATAGDYGTATAGDYGTATAGAGGTATAGDYGTATAGDYGTATAGARGTATAGDYGTATAGAGGTATAGAGGTATAGARGTATAGAGGTATAGYAGTATAGYAGTATAGARGTATAGYDGTATAGDGGTATAGARGVIQIARWDALNARYRIYTGYVGEDDIEAGVAYKLSADGKFIRA